MVYLMPRKKKRNPVSEYLAKIGRKGGSARVPKGVAKLSEAERKKRAQEAAAKRWGKKKGKAGD